MSPVALSILRRRASAAPGPYVFSKADGSRHSSNMRSVWDRVRREAGLMNFRFHDLRHCTASFMAMNGESQFVLQEVLGHKGSQMTKRYAHLDPRTYKDAGISVDKVLQRSLGEKSGDILVTR